MRINTELPAVFDLSLGKRTAPSKKWRVYLVLRNRYATFSEAFKLHIMFILGLESWQKQLFLCGFSAGKAETVFPDFDLVPIV